MSKTHTQKHTHTPESYADFTNRTMLEIHEDLRQQGFSEAEIDELYMSIEMPQLNPVTVSNLPDYFQNHLIWVKENKFLALIYLLLGFGVVFGILLGAGAGVWVISEHSFILLFTIAIPALMSYGCFYEGIRPFFRVLLVFLTLFFLIFSVIFLADKVKGIQQSRIYDYQVVSCGYDSVVYDGKYACLETDISTFEIERTQLDKIDYIDVIYYPVSDTVVDYGIVFKNDSGI